MRYHESFRDQEAGWKLTYHQFHEYSLHWQMDLLNKKVNKWATSDFSP